MNGDHDVMHLLFRGPGLFVGWRLSSSTLLAVSTHILYSPKESDGQKITL